MTFNIRMILACSLTLVLGLSETTRAGDTPPSSANSKMDTCNADAAKYAHGALTYFGSMLCMVNVQFPGVAEEALYHLVVDMGLNPDTSKLAASGATTDLGTKTHGGKTVTGTVQKVVSPDTFAGTYDFLGSVLIDGVQQMKIYWSGSGSSSKGFLILGGATFGTTADKHLLYIKWDRTVETAQSVSVLATMIQSGSTYLANVQPLTTGGRNADRALFAATTYNNSTKAVSVQMTTIGARRGAQSSSTTPGCFMMYATGTKGGTISVAKSQDSLSSTGDSVSSTTQNGTTNMDAVSLTDSVSTANGTGGIAAPGFTMFYSCDDLNQANGSGKPFNGNTVNFSMTKTQMDTMFAAN